MVCHSIVPGQILHTACSGVKGKYCPLICGEIVHKYSTSIQLRSSAECIHTRMEGAGEHA